MKRVVILGMITKIPAPIAIELQMMKFLLGINKSFTFLGTSQ